MFRLSPIKTFLRGGNNLKPQQSRTLTVTALHDFHVENGGKLVNFSNHSLPVQYNDQSITASHLHTRQACSLFDVSHMLQTEIAGAECVEYFETICTADLKNLPTNSGTLTVFSNEYGGIFDDLIVTKIRDDLLFVVSNAAMRQQDQKIMVEALERYKLKKPKTNIKLKFFDTTDRSLVALQGPKSAEILQDFVNINLADLYFMESSEVDVLDCGACRITRCGYTGEDGFEISLPSFRAADICRQIYHKADGIVKLAGLGARDSLRLEAGLCLYGHDITQTTTPIEAGLGWLVAKRRRHIADFPGATIILKQIQSGVARKRVGLIMEANSPPARQNTVIADENGNEIGAVTSGCPSPTLNRNIAMGYVPKDSIKNGTKLLLRIREKFYNANVTKMPFVPSHYYTKTNK